MHEQNRSINHSSFSTRHSTLLSTNTFKGGMWVKKKKEKTKTIELMEFYERITLRNSLMLHAYPGFFTGAFDRYTTNYSRFWYMIFTRFAIIFTVLVVNNFIFTVLVDDTVIVTITPFQTITTVLLSQGY